MENEKKIYLPPQTNLIALPSDPIMLSPGGDSNEGIWQMLTNGTDTQNT